MGEQKHTVDGRGDRPSRHGALMGDLLAKLAEAGARDDLDGILEFMCVTCAFRRGSLPNTSAGTALIAYKCAIGADPDPFGCHHGMVDGKPERLCAGYLAAQKAPFDLVKSATQKLHEALADLGHDDVQAEFDEWADRIDPDNKLDVYVLARKWANRFHSLEAGKGGVG